MRSVAKRQPRTSAIVESKITSQNSAPSTYWTLNAQPLLFATTNVVLHSISHHLVLPRVANMLERHATKHGSFPDDQWWRFDADVSKDLIAWPAMHPSIRM